MSKVFGIQLEKTQIQMTCLDFDPRDFDRMDQQISYRILENKDFLGDVYYHYNDYANDFDKQINRDLYNTKLEQNRLISNVFWLYFCQLDSSSDFEEEVSRQKLKFVRKTFIQESAKKEKDCPKFFDEKGNPKKKKSLRKMNTTTPDYFSKGSFMKISKKDIFHKNIYSNKSFELSKSKISEDEDSEFNIFNNDSVESLPNEIYDYYITLKSGYYEKRQTEQEGPPRFIGDQGFITRAERKILTDLDRVADLIKETDTNESEANIIEVQRDKQLNIREIFKDLIDKILEYIMRKYPKGKVYLYKLRTFYEFNWN